jgi:hypothetical protein
MTASGTTTGTICAEPATTSAAVKSWVVTFPTGFTPISTVADWTTTNISTTSNSAWPAGAVAWPNAAAATPTVSSPSVTWTNSSVQTMSSSTIYCYNWTLAAALTEPSSASNNEAGTITTQIAGPSTIDSGTFSTATVANDIINVTGTVGPSFTVNFTANADPLGTLTTGAVATSSASVIDVSSNAKNGWSAWVEDSNNGLKSPSLTYTIPSTTTPGVGNSSVALTAGTEGMNLGVAYSQTSGTCTAGSAVPSTFVATGGKGGSFNSSTYQTILSCAGTTSGGVVTPTNNVAISGATPYATDYADNETIVTAGNF